MLPTYPTHSSLKNSSLPNPHIRYVDISSNYLNGGFPHFIQNMTSLEYLDLSSNNFGTQIPLWLGKLKSLTHLNLKANGFQGIEGGNLWEVVRSLCSLKSLDLSRNQLQGNLLEPRVNSSTAECTDFALEILDLSTNVISGHKPAWIGEEFRSLKFLFLGHNNISGEIPKSIGMLSSMQSLDISSNMISGEIPKFIGMLSSMESLDISSNMISGEIPKSIGMLSSMESLDISYNPLEAAVLSESHFVNLSSLRTLDMKQTFLTLNLSSDWVPPFQLQHLFVDSCKINGPFPQWFKTQKEFGSLNLSNANIHGVLPKWFHKMHSLQDVHLSNNQITRCPIFPIHFKFFSLSNNSVSCLFMTNDSYKNAIYNEASIVDLSHNNISGKLPEYLYHKMPVLRSLDISNNQLNGSIPKSMCHFTSLDSLYLSSNKLSGNIPCFNSTSLHYLHLNDNMLSGEVPSCLANLSSLTVLNLGENELSGGIPTWLTVSNNVPHLQILRLRSNKLKGNILKQLCSLSQLQLLDFEHNYLTGTIPNCLSNLTSMMHPVNYSNYEEEDGVMEVIQGIERKYTTTLGFLLSIDLSCNNLVGSIPDGITNLQGLFNLNLSYNQLTGLIPRNIGGLESLVSLDFSRNKLHGMIPTSMADLYALGHIDLSYNNFSGQIPTGHQLQTLDDPSNYAGNPYLCGDPLPKKCKSKKDSSKSSGDENDNQGEGDDDMHDKMWFYLIVMSGFATGFWGVVGTLLLKKSWRHALFRRVEDAQEWFYVAIVVWMAKLKKKWDASSDGSKYIGG